MRYSQIGRLVGRMTRSAIATTAILSGMITVPPNAFGQENRNLEMRGDDEVLRAPAPDTSERLGGQSIFGEIERLPAVQTGKLALPPIMAATTKVDEIGNGSTPKEFRRVEETPLSDLPESGTERDAGWVATNYQFAAANTFSHPRYFEDRMLERHGHERFPHLQPFVSGARFFGTFPMLPYLMTVSPPCECEYQLGYFRPGDCVYPYLQRPPYQRDAVIVEAAAVAGAIIAVP